MSTMSYFQCIFSTFLSFERRQRISLNFHVLNTKHKGSFTDHVLKESTWEQIPDLGCQKINLQYFVTGILIS